MEEAIARGGGVRIEETLQLIESGRVEVPFESDFMTFLLSDGKLSRKLKIEASLTVAELFDNFFAALPEGHLEASTHKLMQIHRRHLEGEFGRKTPTADIGQQSDPKIHQPAVQE